MTTDCSKIIFSNRAYNSIVSETYDKIKTETGGILLGRIINDIWYVVEVIDPGPNSIFTVTYFEYDTPYVNHLAKAISKQYKIELAVLGLWHRHPGSMDTFSSTDDGTNSDFSRLHPNGAISGLVNIDPNLRLTMYHVSMPLRYTKTSFEVGDALIPGHLLSLKYSEAETTFFSKNEQETFRQQEDGERKKPRRNILNKFFDTLFKKPETTIIINNYSPNENSIPETKKLDEDYLVDLYTNEEIQLENNLKVNYESEVQAGKIVYSIKEFTDGRKIDSAISFNVNLDVSNPMFHCSEKDLKFSKGIFSRYVESKLNNSEFVG